MPRLSLRSVWRRQVEPARRAIRDGCGLEAECECGQRQHAFGDEQAGVGVLDCVFCGVGAVVAVHVCASSASFEPGDARLECCLFPCEETATGCVQACWRKVAAQVVGDGSATIEREPGCEA